MRLVDSNALKEKISHEGLLGSGYSDGERESDVCAMIDEMPTIKSPVKHGKWIDITNGCGGHECSECRSYAPSFQSGLEYESPYCPNCGTDMRTKDKND